MILIADSGSTKTSWSLVNPQNGSAENCQTAGINPLYQDETAIFRLLQEEFRLATPDPVTLYFYGAGCINHQVNETVREALTRFFRPCGLVIDTDLMAAAHSLCQEHEGIACILGTGSNSCYYNGHTITRHVSPLGYILGDEGSGAMIGRKFIADLLKNQLPVHISERFFSTYELTPHQIIEQVYKKPFPNRFLARFTRFVHSNLEEDAIRTIVKNSFDDFFTRNIRQYPEAQQTPVHFTGSIAFYFETLLRESAEHFGFETGIITESPMEGLIQFHLCHS
jgi:N-acetylglucosamine kinase-like BadF-type ATPase